MTAYPRSHFLAAIQAAQREGFDHYAESLRRLYAREFLSAPTTALAAAPSTPSADTQKRRQAVKESHDPWGIHPAS